MSFTHYPASMFITDLKVETIKVEPSREDIPQVVQISPPRLPYFASLVSTKALDKLREIELAIIDDPGHCGIDKLREDNDFVKSVITLSHSKSVAVVFGFPCNVTCENLEETDGPPGAFSIAQALQALGKEVVIVSEERNRQLVQCCVEYLVSVGALVSDVKFLSCNELIQSKGIDCIVSIERVGEAEDGLHYTCNGVDVSKYLEPIDTFFANCTSALTIGIGDRGNELGLGKVREKVKKVMKDGIKLGCNISSDYVILSGVSNWGGYGISVGLYAIANCTVHSRYISHGIDYQKNWNIDQFLPTNEQVIINYLITSIVIFVRQKEHWKD